MGFKICINSRKFDIVRNITILVLKLAILVLIEQLIDGVDDDLLLLSHLSRLFNFY